MVNNVAAFGAFADIGVHQDGLVHISQLADRFVKDPNQVVKVGQSVQVKVLSVDLQRKRIGLTMRRGAVEAAAQQSQWSGKAQPLRQGAAADGDPAAALKKTGFRVKQGEKG